jgi:hypothetical protein
VTAGIKPFLNVLAVTFGSSALAQVHVVEGGAYTLRANAVHSDELPSSTASQHGIERAADRGVLNVVVLERRDGRQRPVRAQVHAARFNLLGQEEPIEMRAVEANGRVSYLGSFGFGPLRNMLFRVTATPAGSSDALTVEFEERFVVRDR